MVATELAQVWHISGTAYLNRIVSGFSKGMWRLKGAGLFLAVPCTHLPRRIPPGQAIIVVTLNALVEFQKKELTTR